MRMRDLVVLTTFGCLLLTTTNVAAEPPAGSTCVSGYNPDAVTNVCYITGPGSTVNVPGVTFGAPVCVIGEICAPVGVPGLGPSSPRPVPGATAPSYVEVAGIELYSSDGSIDPPRLCKVQSPATNTGNLVAYGMCWAGRATGCIEGEEPLGDRAVDATLCIAGV
jgi:hypothetical protein